MSSVADVLHFLEQSSWAVYIRQSSWLYPCLEIIHITGIVVVVGPAFLFDVRLLGFSKHRPADDLKFDLLAWSTRGLLLVIPSGMLLFVTNAATLGYDAIFWMKMLLLALAAVNAFLFRLAVFESLVTVKLAAVFSLMLWVAIIACGRLLAY